MVPNIKLSDAQVNASLKNRNEMLQESQKSTLADDAQLDHQVYHLISPYCNTGDKH